MADPDEVIDGLRCLLIQPTKLCLQGHRVTNLRPGITTCPARFRFKDGRMVDADCGEPCGAEFYTGWLLECDGDDALEIIEAAIAALSSQSGRTQ